MSQRYFKIWINSKVTVGSVLSTVDIVSHYAAWGVKKYQLTPSRHYRNIGEMLQGRLRRQSQQNQATKSTLWSIAGALKATVGTLGEKLQRCVTVTASRRCSKPDPWRRTGTTATQRRGLGPGDLMNNSWRDLDGHSDTQRGKKKKKQPSKHSKKTRRLSFSLCLFVWDSLRTAGYITVRLIMQERARDGISLAL